MADGIINFREEFTSVDNLSNIMDENLELQRDAMKNMFASVKE